MFVKAYRALTDFRIASARLSPTSHPMCLNVSKGDVLFERPGEFWE